MEEDGDDAIKESGHCVHDLAKQGNDLDAQIEKFFDDVLIDDIQQTPVRLPRRKREPMGPHAASLPRARLSASSCRPAPVWQLVTMENVIEERKGRDERTQRIKDRAHEMLQVSAIVRKACARAARRGRPPSLA
eukprot:496609-Prymnesium_polylepis.1